MSRRGLLRRAALRLAWAALLVAAGALPAAAVPQDEIVPEGVVLFRVSAGSDRRDEAIDRANKERPLLHYLIADKAVVDALEGSVERTFRTVALTVHYGLSDSWNLALEVPQVTAEQTSSLRPAAGVTDPDVEAAAKRFGDETLSGLGDLRLLSLHRPVFSDRNGLVWGYGLQVPPGDQQNDYAGIGTLAVRSPAPSVLALIHYTRYPALGRARFDARGELSVGLADTVTTVDGESESIRPGSAVTVDVGWRQEIGPVAAGLRLEHRRQGSVRLGGSRQEDNVVETAAGLELGFGNLSALEEGPVAFPYLVELSYERTLDGFNTPFHNAVRLTFQTYF